MQICIMKMLAETVIMKITTLHSEILQIHMKLLHTQRLNIFIKYRRRYVKNDNVMLMLILPRG